MARPSRTGGVVALGHDRIRFDFTFEGRRYRLVKRIVPTEENLARARLYLAYVNQQIAAGTFDFAREFPWVRRLNPPRAHSRFSANLLRYPKIRKKLKDPFSIRDVDRSDRTSVTTSCADGRTRAHQARFSLLHRSRRANLSISAK